MSLTRILQKEIEEYFFDIPVTAIIGARQTGKTTLAKAIITALGVKEQQKVIQLDLEKKSDRQLISNTEDFLNYNKGSLIMIDEIQLMPEVFSAIRSFVDENPASKFLILGSSSPEISQKGSESLAGRIFYFELSPFLWLEVKERKSMELYRLIGGMPMSFLAKNTTTSFVWLKNYIRTFLERDLRNFGFNIPPATLRRLWVMVAHINGQVLNYSQLANAMGVSHTTIKHYIDVLEHTFMLRIIQPYHVNIKKRLVKSPKVYFRDTGVLHALLNIETFNDLYAHPVYGSSWEVTVIENIIAKYSSWDFFFYRTAKGVEIDLILTKNTKTIAIEIKASSTPKVTTGFWNALEDIQPNEAYIIANVKMPYPMEKGVMVYPLEDFLTKKIT
tara:strand:- start:3720 stop:4883 length:1164 start_codon:yes stop_codon:yes gene_type:complete